MQYAIGAVALVILLAGAVPLMSEGISRNEVVECNKWKEQAAEFPAQFYLLKWQWEQCNGHGITIKSHIRK